MIKTIISKSNPHEVKFIISKKKHIVFFCDKKNKYKILEYYKNNIYHKPCNLGPQTKDNRHNKKWIEYGLLHNLYGYALIYHSMDYRSYYIRGIEYEEEDFNQYIKEYNSLTYKRSY